MKIKPSPVRVDGEETYLVRTTIEDENIDPSLPYDQMLMNVVNTQMGVTMKRKIFQYSSEYNSNYIVIENTFINTGNIDGDEEIERTSVIYKMFIFTINTEWLLAEKQEYYLVILPLGVEIHLMTKEDHTEMMRIILKKYDTNIRGTDILQNLITGIMLADQFENPTKDLAQE